MKTEIEAKFLSIDKDEIRRKLLDAGAVCVTPMRLMRRAIIDYSDRRLQTGQPSGYIRVRDEGNKITLTYKQFDSLTVDGAKEIETVVDSFEDTVSLLTAIGLEVVSIQESRRETWEYENCEIMLDEWPWLNPYIEIEGADEETIRDVSSKLGLDWSDAVFGDVMVVYRHQYPYLTDKQTIGTIKEVLFESTFPEDFEEKS
jgi:adenylate cyclase, class 2